MGSAPTFNPGPCGPGISPDICRDIEVSKLRHSLRNLRTEAERQQVKRTHVHLFCLMLAAVIALALLISGAVVMSTAVACLAEPIALVLERLLDL